MKNLNLLLKTLLPAVMMLFGSLSAGGANLALWDAPNNGSNWLTELDVTNSDVNVTATKLLRGSGLGSSSTPAGYSFGGSGADQTTLTNAISGGDYFTMTIKANDGYELSLTGIPAWWTRKSGSGTMSVYVQYSLNGVAFADAGSISVTSTGAPGGSTPLTFSSAAQTALSGLPSTTTVTLRFVVVSSTSANIYLITGNATNSTNRFVIAGTVTPAASSCAAAPAAPTAGTAATTSSSITWNWTAPASGDAPTRYRYNTVNDSTTVNGAVKTTSLSYPQSGLSAATPYMLYVWAENACGVSENPAMLSASTSCITPTVAFSTGSVNQPFSAGAYQQTVTTNSGGAVTYSSSNPSVADVDPATGEVTFHTAGQTIISADQAAEDGYCEEDASYTLNIAYTVASSINNSSLGSILQTGYVITATPNSCVMYDSPAFTVTSGSATVSQEDNVFTVTPTSDCNVEINFVIDPGYTVTYHNEGAAFGSDTGCSIVLPTPTSGCEFGGWVFAGWTTTSSVSGTIAPTFVSNPYTPTRSIDLYAVYQQTTGGTGDYELLTAAPADWAGDYLIATSSTLFFNGSLPNGTNANNIAGVDNYVSPGANLSGNTVVASWGDTYKFSLVPVTGGYVLKSASDVYVYTTGITNGMTGSLNEATAAAYPITPAFVSSSDIRFALTPSTVTLTLRYNSQSGQNRFRYYTNAGQDPIYVYKKATQTTTYNTAPICPPILDSFTIKWTEAVVAPPANGSDGTIVFSNLNTDQTDCMEVYFELNSAYSTDDYEVYLEGIAVAPTQLGTELDMDGNPSAYICFGNISGWTGTLTVIEKSSGNPIETYDVSVSNSITTGVNEANKDNPLQTTQCYSVTGVRLDCNKAQGIIIKRSIYTDGSIDVVKELK